MKIFADLFDAARLDLPEIRRFHVAFLSCDYFLRGRTHVVLNGTLRLQVSLERSMTSNSVSKVCYSQDKTSLGGSFIAIYK